MSTSCQTRPSRNTATAAEKPAIYRGLTLEPSGRRGFTFLIAGSIKLVAGRPENAMPKSFFVHCANNPKLGDPVPGDRWVRFCLRPSPMHPGRVEVFDAEFEK